MNAGRIEAIYLHKILDFVQWPAAQPPNDSPFRVCVTNRYAVSFALSQELRATLIEGRRVEVQIVQKEQDLKSCQVLFIGATDAKQRAKFLDASKGAQVLTVSDEQGFLEMGGILMLRYDGNAMKFEVNLQAAKQVGLRFDARLLSMAHRVVIDRSTEYGASHL